VGGQKLEGGFSKLSAMNRGRRPAKKGVLPRRHGGHGEGAGCKLVIPAKAGI
jgi:hypothetical protein